MAPGAWGASRAAVWVNCTSGSDEGPKSAPDQISDLQSDRHGDRRQYDRPAIVGAHNTGADRDDERKADGGEQNEDPETLPKHYSDQECNNAKYCHAPPHCCYGQTASQRRGSTVAINFGLIDLRCTAANGENNLRQLKQYLISIHISREPRFCHSYTCAYLWTTHLASAYRHLR
jgi:hypothetical protein